ncbi:hypothetical protein [Streptomyces marianii]|uniref:hypothetical protein n=1 Tax=Streptomyces marianii TaxID=1817406 RepID=UPI0018F8CA6B|nr:hypothetical protein [Streptomyces marianii]
MVITLSPAHVHLCPRHQLWTRSTHDIPLGAPPEVIEAQRRLDQLARRHPQTGRALDMARKIVEDWSASGMPIDPGKERTDRLDQVEALAVSKKISAEDRSHLAAFPEIVVLTHLILDPRDAPHLTPRADPPAITGQPSDVAIVSLTKTVHDERSEAEGSSELPMVGAMTYLLTRQGDD